MNKIKTKFRATSLDEVLKEALKDKKTKELFDEYGRQLEISYQILQLRRAKKISQADLAQKIGSTQSNIARLEGGNQNFTIKLLEKVARALGAELSVKIS
ncbi:MAG: helix-turn-helix domain-containing protein [Patescibacteria group bacterium]